MKELLEFLYPSVLDTSEDNNPDNNKGPRAIQMILAKQDKSVIGWYPGKRKKKFDWGKAESLIVKRKSLVGFTGKVYRDFEISMENQSYSVHWVAIDIDDTKKIDNVQNLKLNIAGYVDTDTVDNIYNMLNQQCSIRLSTSGRGLHLIFRLDKPGIIPTYKRFNR